MVRFFEIIEFCLDQNNITTNPYSNDAITRIGCRGSTSDSAFNGLIDDVMLFDRTLSGDEIQTLFNFGNLSYDAAGNLTQDQRGYEYEYDYENRIVKITKGTQTKAEFAYDALGRRIRKIDSVASETTLYYHNYKCQVLAEYNGSDTLQRTFIYGNYIDEVLLMKVDANDYYYVHDHLYSPAVLASSSGTVLERCEYDAYGNCYVLEPNFAPDPDGQSDYGNPYLFTGRRVDILDSSSLKIQYNRNRYYDYYSGRWLTHDPLGIIPSIQKSNVFNPINQYIDGINLYEFIRSDPINNVDPFGELSDGARVFIQYVIQRLICEGIIKSFEYIPWNTETRIIEPKVTPCPQAMERRLRRIEIEKNYVKFQMRKVKKAWWGIGKEKEKVLDTYGWWFVDKITVNVYRCVCINPNLSYWRWRVVKKWEWEHESPWALVAERKDKIIGNVIRAYMKVRTRHEAKHFSYCQREPKMVVPPPWVPPIWF